MYAVQVVQVLPHYDVFDFKVNGMAYPKIRVGTEIFLRTEVRNMSNVEQPLADPDGGVMLTIRRPDGSAPVSDGTMITGGPGIYTFFYQSATTDLRGVYRVSFKISESDGTVVYTVPVDAFELVP